MHKHQYTLEPYKGMNTRYRCPNCNDTRKTFSRYIDANTHQHIDPNVGKCDRENNCGYHFTPKQYFEQNNIFISKNRSTALTRPSAKMVSYSIIDQNVFMESLKSYETNYFVQFLLSRFDKEKVVELINRYYIATSKCWHGASVFWQRDLQGKIRTGKIMLYNPSNGKRIKEPINHITWAHKAIKLSEFNLQQCFFGEHLLIDKTKIVAIVESEKTAVIASLYIPNLIWLATGGKENLNLKIFSVLKGRNVVLYPDIDGFDKWTNKAKELSSITKIRVSNLLEKNATVIERKKQYDIADYLLQYDLNEFISCNPQTKNKEQIHIHKNTSFEENILPNTPLSIKSRNTEILISSDWKQTIEELTDYFEKKELPKGNILLKQGVTIINVTDFVKSHLTTTKTNEGKAAYLPFINRLVELKCYLEMKSNYDKICEN